MGITRDPLVQREKIREHPGRLLDIPGELMDPGETGTGVEGARMQCAEHLVAVAQQGLQQIGGPRQLATPPVGVGEIAARAERVRMCVPEGLSALGEHGFVETVPRSWSPAAT